MSNKKIIKIEKVYDTSYRYKRVEWWLHNVCNFDCSFCPTDFKSGNLRWLDLSDYKKFCSKLMDQANQESKIIFFQFLGGEPTLFPHLLELSKFIVQQNHIVTIMSNGSRTLRYWQDWVDADIINTLYLTIHPEQTQDIDHYVKLINLFENTNTLLIPRISAPKNHFQLADKFFDVLYEETASVIALHPINGDFKYNDYSPEQLDIFKKKNYVYSKKFQPSKYKHNHIYPNQLEITYNDLSTSVTTPQDLYLNKLNNFLGWKCEIGIDFLHIFHTDIYRGLCKQDGIIGNILDPDSGFLSKPTTCLKNSCFCRADIGIKKYIAQ